MSRIVSITSATAALLLSASALAWGWQAGSRLTLVTSDGKTVVGVGSVDVGRLELNLSGSFNGFAVLVVESSDGALATLDVVVDGHGGVLISDQGDFVELADSVAGAGLEFALAIDAGVGQPLADEPDSRVGPDGGVEGGALGRPAETGLERAEERADEHAAAGLDRAAEVGNRSVGEAAPAKPDAKTNNGVEVDVEIGAGGAGVDKRVGAGGRVGNGRD